MALPVIKTITDLRNSDEMADICNNKGNPAIITRNGKALLVLISAALFEEYEAMKVRLDLYEKLAVAEAEAETGFDGHLMDDVFNELMADLQDE